MLEWLLPESLVEACGAVGSAALTRCMQSTSPIRSFEPQLPAPGSHDLCGMCYICRVQIAHLYVAVVGAHEHNKQALNSLFFIGLNYQLASNPQSVMWEHMNTHGAVQGTIGLGVGKASEVAAAVSKADKQALKSLFFVPRYHGATIHQMRKVKYGEPRPSRSPL